MFIPSSPPRESYNDFFVDFIFLFPNARRIYLRKGARIHVQRRGRRKRSSRQLDAFRFLLIIYTVFIIRTFRRTGWMIVFVRVSRARNYGNREIEIPTYSISFLSRIANTARQPSIPRRNSAPISRTAAVNNKSTLRITDGRLARVTQ